MPIYEFQCRVCGHPFEQRFATTDYSDATCPQCGAADVQKLLSAFWAGKSMPSSKSCDSCADTGGAPCCSGGGCPLSG